MLFRFSFSSSLRPLQTVTVLFSVFFVNRSVLRFNGQFGAFDSFNGNRNGSV